MSMDERSKLISSTSSINHNLYKMKSFFNDISFSFYRKQILNLQVNKKKDLQ